MTKKIVISTWNVNGLRASFKKGLEAWLKKERPDIVCLQETKISSELIEFFTDEFKDLGYRAYFACAKKKGYSGVALLVRQEISEPKVEIGLGIDKFDDEGRTIIAHFENFALFCCYYPNGQRDHNRVPYKLEYSEEVAKKFLTLAKKKCSLIAGDINTAHQEIDLKNPKQNVNTTGFLPVEREFLTSFFDRGAVDIFRTQHPELAGAYTWWTYRGNCREKNVGWRIDAIYVDKKSSHLIKDSYHSPHILGSDHCPTNILFEIS